MSPKDAKTLSRTTGFASLAAKLYKAPDTISLTEMIQILNLAGVKVPKGVVVTADVCQILVAGGAMVDNAEAAASIGAYVAPTAAIMYATMDLMEQAGLLDKNSPGAQMLTLGLDTALVVAGGGVNVIADLKFVIDIYAASQLPDVQAMAEQSAKSDVAQYVNGMLKVEQSSFVKNFADYHSGKINSFDLMLLAAEESPELFYNYYPGMRVFIPPMAIQFGYTSTYSSSNIWGDSNSGSSTAYQTVDSLGDPSTYRPDTLKPDYGDTRDKVTGQRIPLPPRPVKSVTDMLRVWDFISDKILGPYLAIETQRNVPLVYDDKYGWQPTGPQSFSLKTLAALSLLPPFIQKYDEKWNPFPIMAKSGLTFSDLEESWIVPNSLDEVLAGPVGQVPNQGSDMIYGMNYWNSEYRPRKSMTQAQANMLRFDRAGNYKGMVSNMDKDVYASILKKVSPNYRGADRTSIEIHTSLQDIRNYWNALHFWNTMKDDPVISAVRPLVDCTKYDFLTPLRDVDALARKISFKVNCRSLNRLARQNIALFLGTSTDKLYVSNPKSLGKGPAVFAVK